MVVCAAGCIARIHAKVPSVQTGKVFRLRGKGIKGVRSSSQGNAQRHSPRAQGWLDRVKDFFGG